MPATAGLLLCTQRLSGLMARTPSATSQRLRQYIAERMCMSHVSQPLMLMELLGRRSPAPAQDVARRILGEDVPQIDYYTERVKRMVGKVLICNGITRCEKGSYALVGGDELSEAEREHLLELCRKRLHASRQQCGEQVFTLRSRQRTPISGSIKYRVLTRARSRCECCGAHEHQRALEVDHIVPKNQGGSDDLRKPAGPLLPLQCRQTRHRFHRLPRCEGQLRPARGGLSVKRPGGSSSPSGWSARRSRLAMLLRRSLALSASSP